MKHLSTPAKGIAAMSVMNVVCHEFHVALFFSETYQIEHVSKSMQVYAHACFPFWLYTVAMHFHASQEWVYDKNGGLGIRKLKR